MLAQHSLQRHLPRCAAAPGELLEHGRLVQETPQVHRHQAEHAAKNEGNAPGEIADFARRVVRVDGNRDQRPQQDAARDARSQRAYAEAVALGGHVLGHEDPRTGHLPADGRALQHAHRQQQKRRCNADAGAGRQQADHQRGRGHQENRQREHALAAEQVAEMGDHDAAQGTGQITRGEDAKGLQLAKPIGHVRRKEQPTQHGGEENKDHEVVELERAAERRERERLVVVGTQRAVGGARGTGSRVGNGHGSGRNIERDGMPTLRRGKRGGQRMQGRRLRRVAAGRGRSALWGSWLQDT